MTKTVDVILNVSERPPPYQLQVSPTTIRASLREASPLGVRPIQYGIGTVHLFQPFGRFSPSLVTTNSPWIDVGPIREGKYTYHFLRFASVRVLTRWIDEEGNIHRLPPGLHTGTITFTCLRIGTRTVEIILTVAPSPYLSVEPTELRASLQQCNDWTEIGEVTLTKQGIDTLSWFAEDDKGWIRVSPGSGALTPGETATVTVEATTAGLEVGEHRGTVTFMAPGYVRRSAIVRIPITLEITDPPPVLSVEPSSLDFGKVTIGQSEDLSFTVVNEGGGTLKDSATASAPFSIVSGSPFSLEPGESTTVTVRFSPTATGPFSETVTFTTNGGNLARDVSGVGVTPFDTDGDGLPDDWELEQKSSSLNRSPHRPLLFLPFPLRWEFF